ncbi:MAG: hypothetical protein IKP65_01305, partial [Alphaproteobacteria bacterium]|nr:hypothetical protein [Alphaproteobacteria bacterium]
ILEYTEEKFIMHIDICKSCKEMDLYFNVYQNGLKYNYEFYCIKKETLTYIWILTKDSNLIESYKFDCGKWKLIEQNKHWFKLFKQKFINDKLKEILEKKDYSIKFPYPCLYQMEHKLINWNKRT